jgi:[ribosomal protein S18]-alanine N-acetyltransferase
MSIGRRRTEPMLSAMALDDLDEILAIERVSFPTPWTQENFRHEIESNAHAWNVVLREDGRVAAYACCYLIAGELQINVLAVDPARRRCGYASRLLDDLLAGARGRGAVRASLEVRPSNLAALALYGSRGFEPTGRRRGYYADTGEDAILMARSL